MENLSTEIKELLANQKLGYVATVCPDNTPNLSPKGTIIPWNNGKLAFADIKSPNTISNLEKNPSVEINVVDPLTRKGYRFKGTSSILRGGEEFAKIISHYKKIGIKSEIQAVVLVQIQTFKEVTSPLYDLGHTEEEIKERWKKHYLSSS